MSQENRLKEFQEHHEFLCGIKNLTINFGPVNKSGDHPLEQVYFSNIFRYLIEWEDFNQYDFYIIGIKQPYDCTFNERSIVFCLSNEDHIIPEDMHAARIIFSPYSPLNKDFSNCYPIPLGYNGSLYNIPYKKIGERRIGVFFSGNIYRKRINFFFGILIHQLVHFITSLNKRSAITERIQFTRKFTGGLDPKEYSEILMDSRIALVPEGYLSNVSFRFFEAAKMGCIVITRDLYDYWFFKEFPGYQLKSWWQVHRYIKKILSSPEEQKALQEKMKAYYQNYCSEKATANYVIRKIVENKKSS